MFPRRSHACCSVSVCARSVFNLCVCVLAVGLCFSVCVLAMLPLVNCVLLSVMMNQVCCYCSTVCSCVCLCVCVYVVQSDCC